MNGHDAPHRAQDRAREVGGLEEVGPDPARNRVERQRIEEPDARAGAGHQRDVAHASDKIPVEAGIGQARVPGDGELDLRERRSEMTDEPEGVAADAGEVIAADAPVEENLHAGSAARWRMAAIQKNRKK